MIREKFATALALILIIGMLFNVSYATEIKTKLDVVKQSAETKYLDNNQGYISKSIVDSDPEKGEVTIEVKLSNSKNSSNQTITKEEYEIFLVIDDSASMNTMISTGGTRKEALYESSINLIDSLLTNYNNIKIGVIKFASKAEYSDTEGNDTINDAEKMCELSSDKDIVKNAINTQSNLGRGTNLEAGLLLANQSFSLNCKNKIIIILTDGAPTNAVNIKEHNNQEIYDATKNKLIDIDNKGIKIISMLTEIEDEKVAEYIFGTSDNPTVGRYYYIADSDIQKVITENIAKDVNQIISNPTMSNIKIVDYFPSDITENFEFSYVNKPNLGTLQEDGINTTNNTITWTIDELKEKEEAVIKYKLKLKDMGNANLLNKVVSTNQKIVLTYKDSNEKEYEVVLSSSPEIKLSEVKQNEENNNSEDSEDNSKSKRKLPDTGEYAFYLGVVSLLAIFIMLIGKKLKNMRDIK
ncbi:MAG: VWA domain-containing protein [Clostridia bacterium]|nr:VWA domain-containing protein [Clostridia bacterium]